jgi:hypothetical protein
VERPLKAMEAVLLNKVDGFFGVAGSLRWPPNAVVVVVVVVVVAGGGGGCVVDLFQMEGALK